MTSNTQNNFSRYAKIFLIVFLGGFALMILVNIFAGSAIPVNSGPVSTAIPNPPTQTSGEDLSPVDDALNHAMSASIAFNTPKSMKIEETAVIEMSIDPSVTVEDIVKQIEAEGEIQTETLLVTPLTKAVLIPQNGQAFEIQALHDTDIQPVDPHEGATRWQWRVTAKKGGLQAMTLVVYRLIKFEDQEYWRQVETYKADINVEVTLQQRIFAFDWKWFVGLLITSLIVPLFMRWLDKRKPKTGKKRK